MSTDTTSAHEAYAVGPYLLVEPLGAGGMGEVYLARSPGARLVALKVIRPEYADDPGFRRRFRREVDAARRVSGFFTAPVLDADPDGPRPWLATAYVPAPSLNEVVKRFGVLTEAALRTLGSGLAEALEAIHAAGLVHRDLKPGNVLVAADGPRVIDFGISKALDAAQATRTVGVLGTPGYMAPEQVNADPDIGPAADVFALGCVLVFAATGVSPFGTGDPAEILYRLVYEPPDLAGLPGSLSPLISACLAKEPAARPSVADVLTALAPSDPASLVGSELQQDLSTREQQAQSILGRQYSVVQLPEPTRPRTLTRRRILGLGAAVGVTGAAVGTAVALGLGGSSSSKTPSSKGTGPAIKAGATAPEAPAPLWTRSQSHDFGTSGRLSLLDDTLVWWDHGTALGFDPAGGSPRWTGQPVNPGDSLTEWLAVVGDVLYGTTVDDQDNDVLFGVDAKGQRVVDVTVPAAGQFGGDVIHHLLAISGRIALVDAGTFKLVAIDLDSGQRLWTKQTTGLVFGAAADDQRCYLQDDTTTYGLDLHTGTVLWTTPNTMQKDALQNIVTFGSSVILCGNSIVALDAGSGKQLWSAVRQASSPLCGMTLNKGRIYLADWSSTAWALDAATGKEIWHTPTPIPLGTDGVLGLGSGMAVSDSLFVVQVQGKTSGLAVYQAADGKVRWIHQTAGASDGGPTWAGTVSGDTVFGGSGTTLSAFRES
jgi:serine/threonine protein kinase